MAKSKPVNQAEPEAVVRVTCVREVRVGGIHYLPGDTALPTPEILASGAFA